jgi:hypothetical protein
MIQPPIKDQLFENIQVKKNITVGGNISSGRVVTTLIDADTSIRTPQIENKNGNDINIMDTLDFPATIVNMIKHDEEQCLYEDLDNGNLGLGQKSLSNLDNATFCTAIGYNAMNSNTDGNYNTCLGFESLEKNDINKNLLKYESNQQQQKKIRKKFYAYLKITVVEQDFKSNNNNKNYILHLILRSST